MNPQKGSVAFSFSSSNIKEGRIKELRATSVVISIQDQNGNIIHEKKKIQLFKFNDAYLSEPISLNVGNYMLMEFLVLDETNNVIYATPIENSELAYLVTDPLPLNFIIANDETAKVSPQVIAIDSKSASDFGYATFSFDLIDTFKFSAGILSYSNETKNFELTDVHVSISSVGNEILFDKTLQNVTNEIMLKEGFDEYIITVTKDGFLPYKKTFSRDALEVFSSSVPLVVTLMNSSINEGLIAFYPFNGNAQDSTLNNLDGFVNGAILTSDRKGLENASYSFDGVNDYINVPHNDLLNLSENFTISLWADVSSSQVAHEGINDILRKWNGNHEGYPFSISYLNAAAPDYYSHKILTARYNGQGCGNILNSYSPIINNDTFIHLVVVKEGDKIRHYLNSVFIEEVNDIVSCSTANTADVTIGCRGNLVRFFKGKIDDIRIYDRAIDTGEVINLYHE